MSTLEQYNEDALCCPVTFIPFTNPVIVPECGHTFDREALVQYKKKECPTCRTRYCVDPIDLPTNWAIVSFLDLDIKAKPNSPIKYSAKQAKKDKKTCIDANAKIMKNNILRKITTLAKNGDKELKMSFCNYTNGMDNHYSNNNNKNDINDRVIKLLKKEKYSVKYETKLVRHGVNVERVNIINKLVISW